MNVTPAGVYHYIHREKNADMLRLVLWERKCTTDLAERTITELIKEARDDRIKADLSKWYLEKRNKRFNRPQQQKVQISGDKNNPIRTYNANASIEITEDMLKSLSGPALREFLNTVDPDAVKEFGVASVPVVDIDNKKELKEDDTDDTDETDDVDGDDADDN